MKTGIVIFAHGSSVPSANEAVRSVTRQVQESGGYELVDTAFLEAARPDLAEAVAGLVNRGAGRIVVAPYFLTLGIHLQRDLPKIVESISLAHHGVEIVVTPPLDGHPTLSAILLERLQPVGLRK